MTSATILAGAPTFLSASAGHGACGAYKNVGAPARGFWFPMLLVLLAETVAILAFYGLDWSWLRQMHVLWLQATLQALGCTVQTAGTLLTVQGQHFQIDPDCTYVDLIVCGLPLLWRFHRRWTANLAAMAAFAAAVVIVNFARVLYGIYAFTHGVSLFWAHDLVDYVLWYPTLAIVALFWMRSLKTLWSAPAERSDDGALGCGGAAGDAELPSQSGVALRLSPQSTAPCAASQLAYGEEFTA